MEGRLWGPGSQHQRRCDLNPELRSRSTVADPEPIACRPFCPAGPGLHPHPWAATLMGGQCSDPIQGDTFKSSRASIREELLARAQALQRGDQG